MSYDLIECDTPDEFFEAYEKMKDKEGYWIGYFYGKNDETTGLSWCPDCRGADPHIVPSLEKFWEDKLVVKANVTRDEWKGNAEHPFRTHPQLGCKGVPTIIVFEKDEQLVKVDDHSLLDDEKVKELLVKYK